MNIVVFAHIFHPEMVTVNEVATMLVERGHKVTVVTGIPNAPVGKIFEGYGFFRRLRESWNGIEIRRNWQVPRGNAGALRLLINYTSFVISGSIAAIRLARKKPDVIFVNEVSPITVALPAILLGKLTKTPVVMWIHDLWPESVSASGTITNERAISIIDALVRFIYRHCDLLLIQSKAMRPSVESRNVEAERIEFFPNPIDTIFQPLENSIRPQALSGVPADAFIVMFAGSIGASQDMPTILAAAHKLRDQDDVHFVIVGGGRELENSRALAVKLGLQEKVHFVGSHPAEEMPVFYHFADIMLVTLLDEPIFALTVPLKTQTYMACAKPVICNVRGETARIVQEADAGFTAPPREPAALAEAILKAYRIRGRKLNILGRNARTYFQEHYNRQKLMDSLEENLHKLAGY